VWAPQVGAHVAWTLDCFTADVTAKFAMGPSTQVVDIGGFTMLYPPAPATKTLLAAGGILAQQTNIPGHTSHGRLVVIPEVAGQLSYEVCDCLRLWVGYSFLYVSEVVRPGNQIDRTVNPAFIPSDQSFHAFNAPPRPALDVHQSSFWANGVNFGVQLRF
jgi:hypothetical protein